MLKRVGTRQSVTDAETRSLAPAVADRLAYSIAGRARYLWELARGQNADSSDTPATPYNPNGDLGVNHSGNPWGCAIRHPMMLMEHDCGLSTAFYGRQQVALELRLVGETWKRRCSFWNRLFQKTNLAPYSRGYLTVMHSRVGGSGSPTFNLSCLNQDENGISFFGGGMTQTITSTSHTVVQHSTFAIYCRAKPAINFVTLDFALASLSTASGINIWGWSINQITSLDHS
jgi:hypothetical protein